MVKGSAKLVIILNTLIPNGEIIACDMILNGFYDIINFFYLNLHTVAKACSRIDVCNPH